MKLKRNACLGVLGLSLKRIHNPSKTFWDPHFVSLLYTHLTQNSQTHSFWDPHFVSLSPNLFVLVPFCSSFLTFIALPPPLPLLLMSTSSSPSTPDHDANPGGPDIPGPSTRRTSAADFEPGPSSSRQRLMNEALPEPVVEILAHQVAIDAAHDNGRLSAASALAIIFQVCCTWREVSRSDHLWQRLTRQIWRRTHLLRATWHHEFIYWHRTVRNFTTGRHSFTIPHFDPSGSGDHRHTLICRSLALSDRHLACGFADGTIRLFDVDTWSHVSTFRSMHGHRFGPFSRCVSGIVMTNNSILAFGRLDGDIYVAVLNEPGLARRAVVGDVVNNGVLVELAGTARRWVGLFAGVPGRAFQIWDSQTEQVISVGGSLTDPDALMGWHMLTELVESVGRIRVSECELVVACTTSRLVCFNIMNPELLLHDVGSTSGFVVTSLDVTHEAFVVIERNGIGTVRRTGSFARVSRFRVRGSWVRGLLGCICPGFVTTYSGGGVLRVWNIEQPVGMLCCTIAIRLGEGNSMVANQRHVAISWNDTSIHLLDFGV